MLKRKTGCFVRSGRKALSGGWPLARTECGASLVEFALVLPLLLLMALATIDFGRLAYMHIEVHNAARAGVAYGAQSHITAANTAGMQTAAQNDTDLSTSSPTSFTATASSFCVCSNNNSQTSSPHVTCVSSSCTGALLVEYVEVDTQANYQPWISWPGAPGSTTVTATVQMQVAQ